MFYLENAQGYKENHFSHDAMIYGYDDEKEIYYMISYNKDHFFAPYTSSYKSLGESLNSTFISDEGVAFGMIRNTDEIVPLETEMIKETISQYLDGNNYLTKYDDKDIYMGVTVYKHTIFWLKNKKSNNNIKFLRIIMEHKVFMLERLRQINADKLLIEQYKKVSDTSVIMWNIALKYLITRQEKLIDDIINKLLYIRSEEGRVLREVIG